MKIYLDVCSLNRPFDNLSRDRIRLESEAVLAILSHCEAGAWTLITGDVVDFEISLIPNEERRENVRRLRPLASVKISTDDRLIRKALEFTTAGLAPLDALHLASALKGRADVFLTSDDDLLYRTRRIRIGINAYNPARWLLKEDLK